MSGKIMGKVWDLELPHNKLIVLLAMADHAHHDGSNVFPSMDLIAWKTGYSKRQVQRIVKDLESDGLLVKTERPGLTNLYSINLDAGELKAPFESQNVTPDKKQKTDIATDIGQNVTPDIQMSQGGGHPDVTPTHDTQMSPEPSLEPSINHIGDSSPELVVLDKDKPKEKEKPQAVDKSKKINPASALGEAFGIMPVTKQDWSLYGKICKTLKEAGILQDEYNLYIGWVRKQSKASGNWKVTIPSLTSNGRPSEYVSKRDKWQASQKVDKPQTEYTVGEKHIYKILFGEDLESA